MDKSKQADACTKLGAAIVASGIAGEVGALVLKGELAARLMMALVAIGLSMMLFGMVYGRIVDVVECIFCRANVPRFYSEDSACYVCLRRRLRYPFGSSSLPVAKACDVCKADRYQSFLIRTGGGKGPTVCLFCISSFAAVQPQLKAYAESKGVPVTAELAEEWGAEQISKSGALK